MQAAQKAVSSPLLEDGTVNGARGVIINVTGGPDLSLMEVNEASCVIQEAAHEDANIIFGAVVDPKLAGKIKITVIATGFDRGTRAARAVRSTAVQTPVDLQNYTGPRQSRGRRWFERSSCARDDRFDARGRCGICAQGEPAAWLGVDAARHGACGPLVATRFTRVPAPAELTLCAARAPRVPVALHRPTARASVSARAVARARPFGSPVQPHTYS